MTSFKSYGPLRIFLFFFTCIFLFSSVAYCQQYISLPKFQNINNNIGVSGNNYFMSRQANGSLQLIENNINDTSFKSMQFSVNHAETGELLFYTKQPIKDRQGTDYFDLLKIYNADNELIENGRFEFSLYDNGKINYHCVVPIIGDNKKFYFFYSYTNLDSAGIYYAIIDMNLNNGKGGIATNNRHLKLAEHFGMVTPIPGNKCNYYLMSYLYDEKKFIIYEIDGDGINMEPVQVYPASASNISASSPFIRLSPDRNYIAFTHAVHSRDIGASTIFYDYTILKFNPEMGHIENFANKFITIGDGNKSYYSYVFTSSIFSPDSRDFYVAVNSGDNKLHRLYKYDLSNFNSWEIFKSQIDIKDSLKVKRPIEFYIYKDLLLTSHSNTVTTSYITAQPYQNFKSILGPADTVLKKNMNGTSRLFPGDMNYFSTFSKPTMYTFTQDDTIQDTALDSVFCADTFAITLAKDSGMYFSWNNGDTMSTITVNNYGKYWVTYKGACAYRMDSFILYDKRQDIAVQKFDTLVCEQRFPIDIINPNKADHYYWNGVMGSNQTKVYQATDSFIAAFELDNCLITDTIRIQSKGWCPCETYIPNAFTPNNDGMNDYFKPIFQGGCVPLQYQFLIYDRWGKLVYRSNKEFDKGWNGMHNENPMPAGVYFYQIEFRSLSLNEPYSEKGEVHLIR